MVNKEGTLTVGAKFSDNEISKDNFTWGEFEFSALSGNDAQTAKIGSSEYWALEYEVYGMESGWTYTAAYVGGTHQLIGFELDGKNDKLSTYGGAWKTPNVISLTAEQSGILRGATESSPAKVTYVRAADKIAVLLNGELMGVYSFASLEIKGDGFGIGGRAGTIKNGTLKNIKYVVGDSRVGFVQEQYLGVTVTAQNGAHADKTIYFIGDTVTLTHDAPSQAGKEFAYYTVDGQKISGDSFVATKKNHTVEAVYEDICSLTLANGITANGQSGATVRVVKGSVVTLAYTGEPEQGKLFDGFTVDNTVIYGNKFTVQENSAIGIKWVDSFDGVTWFDDAESKEHKFAWSNNAYSFDGNIVEGANAWVMKVGVQFTADNAFKEGNWYNLSLLVADNAMLQIRMHTNLSAGGVQFHAMGSSLSDGSQLKKLTDAEATAIFDKFKANAKVEFVVVRNENTFYVFADNVLLLTTEHDFKATGNGFGVGSLVCVAWMKDCVPYDYTFVAGQDKVDAYMESVKKLNAPEYDSLVKYAGGGTFEYTLPVATVTDLTGKTVNQNVTVTATGINGAITVTDGKITLPEYNGTQNVTVTYSSADCINVSIKITFQRSDSAVVFEANEAGVKTVTANGSTITFDGTKHYGDDVGSMKLTVTAKQGNQDYGYLNAFDWGDYDYIEFYVYTETANMNTGALWYGDTPLTQNDWTKVRLNKLNNNGQMSNLNAGRWILRFVCYDNNVDLANVSFWISSMTLGKNA